MPRRKRYDKISEYHRQEIERQMGLLRSRITAATLTLKPFCSHYDALTELERNLRRASNVLRDLDADYVESHIRPLKPVIEFDT